ncbi:FAD-binding protein [bacterium]|nr:FAD-binding protein [bacterium]
MSNYDIAIIGAGPAGSTFAKIVSSKFNVVIIEKRDLMVENSNLFDIEKSCGGLLTSDAQEMLKKMGLVIPSYVLDSNQLFSIHAIDLYHGKKAIYPRDYLNINRVAFDKWLFSLIPKSIDKKIGYYLEKIEKIDNSINFTIRKNGVYEQHSCKYLIGADGAFSKVRKYLKPEQNPSIYSTIQDYYKADLKLNHFVAFFHPQLTDFYGWIIPKESHNIIGLSFKEKTQHNLNKKSVEYFNSIDARVSFMKEKMVKYYPFLENKKFLRKGSIHFRPNSLKEIFLGNENIFLIGEAAGWISPSSAEGISFALETGVILAELFNKSTKNLLSTYIKKTTHIKRRVFFKTIKSPFLYSSGIRNLIFSTKLGQI